MTVAERFAINAVKARKRSGMSQETLGFAAGLHRTEISMIERGLRLPRVDTLVKLATALGVRPEALLDQIEWQTGSLALGRFSLAGEEPREEGTRD
jgi:transcriptional regulator with XRE-family HTH domain